jgi:hypothetical protein
MKQSPPPKYLPSTPHHSQELSQNQLAHQKEFFAKKK